MTATTVVGRGPSIGHTRRDLVPVHTTAAGTTVRLHTLREALG
ncbi:MULTISPECIES: hypothetical protein [Micromonospora]|nr:MULTISPECIES: hypothetical protein [unclassified Micromonospora]